ncbi:TPA: hypothetical protein ACNTWS_002492 [Escherichia coli]
MNTTNIKAMFSNRKISLTLTLITALSLISNIAIGAIWVYINFDAIPAYGDTTEYFSLSKTLIVDQYRGILYPAILRVASILSGYLPVTHLIYTIQLILCTFSIFYFCTTILDKNKRAKSLSFIIAISVTLNPLIAHFCMSILTDSLTTSFTIIFISSLIRALSRDSTTKQTCFDFLIAALSLIMMSSLRIDKLYMSIFVFLFSICTLIFLAKNNVSRALMGLSFLLISASAAIAIKHSTTAYNHNRPPLDISSMAFNRVVWPRMTEVYPFLDNTVKSQITIDDSKLFDSHNNYVYPLLTRELEKPNGKKVIDNITLTTIKHFPTEVAYNVAFDFIKYSLPNFQFPLEEYNILPQSVATSWTIERMEMHRPITTKAYLIVGLVNLLSITLIAAWSLLNNNIKFFRKTAHSALIIISAILTNSALYTLSSGMHAHIRYALPSYTIIQSLLTSMAIVAIYKIIMNKKTGKKISLDTSPSSAEK